MALQSMTGFARHKGEFADVSWIWELRSVNGKSLDVRLRTPPGYDQVELSVRKLTQNKLTRGNIQASLQIEQNNSKLVPTVNEDVLDAVLKLASELQEKVGGELPKVSDILSLRGVLEMEEISLDEEDREKLSISVIESFEACLSGLVQAREDEGEAIARILKGQLDSITSILNRIKSDPDRTPEAILTRLQQQVSMLVSESETLDPQRLHQEAALLAAKADIQEEVDRLDVHLASATELIASDGPVGRRLDFLAQEFNRECNTICSKSNSATVSTAGLDMKLVIDQFREQIQNME